MALTTREVRLARRPQGEPVPEDFELAEAEVRPPADGELLVRNTWMSVDPYMRGRMNDRKSYVPPFELGHAMDGGAVGEVVESRAEGIAPGDLVLHGLGWRELTVVPARAARVVDQSVAPAQAFLGVLGLPGLPAYAGLIEGATLHEREVVE